MHYEWTIIQERFALPESKYTTFIQRDINKYTVVYYYGKLFKKSILKIINLCTEKKDKLSLLTWYLSKNNTLYPNLKGIM